MERRYQIQIMFLTDENPEWRHFYRAKDKRTERNARKEWWHWANYPWNDAGSRPVFRIWDSKRRQAVDL